MKKVISSLLSVVLLFCTTIQLSLVVFASQYISKIDAFIYGNYNIPAYDGDIYEVINNNNPEFTSSQLNQNIYESYGSLDSLGRVTQCVANIDQSLMPTESRGSISSIYPTGWVQNKYDFVSGKYLYNRSHLIGWQLTGENANKNNLMTGTRTFNAVGMLQFENEVAGYIKEDKENNVLYRITPVFQGDNLLATGVIMEAESVDDLGASIKFCVFVYNVENGVSIDYSTGDNIATGSNDISSASVSVAECSYTGKYLKPTVTVKYAGETLTVDKDYTLYYSDNLNAGTAKVKITGINSYTGSVTQSFTIKKAKYTPTISSVTYTYNGSAHCISIKNVKSGSTIKYKTSKSSSYSTKKPTRTNVGKTTVYYNITNPNYYTVSGSKTITVLPKNTSGLKLSATKKGFKASWKKYTTQTTGYQIRYSTSSNMTNAKTVTISNNKTTSKTISKLSSKKKYYVQIRTYKTVNSTKFYSSWSDKKTVTTKK